MDSGSRKRLLVTVAQGVSAEQRCSRSGHDSGVVWLTGLPGAGKSTLAMGLERELFAAGYACRALDGDNLRQGLNADLGFSPAERSENVRRTGETAALFAHSGLICIVASISPYRSDRERARRAAGGCAFHEIYVAAGAEVCEMRDPKGLYRQARLGVLRDFTGVDAPYEPPVAAELMLDTMRETFTESLQRLRDYVCSKFPLHAPGRVLI